MGCFVSLFHHNRDREAVLHASRLDESNPTNYSDINATDSDVLLYCPDSNAFGSTNNSQVECDDNKLGILLKRKDFKWRQNESMSEDDLKLKRSTFWETCYTFGGQPQVWDALKLVCQEGSDDLQLSRSILESCGVILPYGQLTEIYDSKGFRYHLPPYCVCAPLVEQASRKKPIDNTGKENKVDKVKIRLSDGKDFALNLEDQESVSDVKLFIRDQEHFDSKKRMVVLWCGKVLDDSVKLRSLNLPKGAVLQVMIP